MAERLTIPFVGWPDPRQLDDEWRDVVVRTMTAIADEWSLHAHEAPDVGTVYMASFMRSAASYVDAARRTDG